MSRKNFAWENFPPDIQSIADAMNLDENAVDDYTVPPLPIDENTCTEDFEKTVRTELLKKSRDFIYGEIPPLCEKIHYRLRSENKVFDGLAIRREIDIICSHSGDEQILHLLLYIPVERQGKVPVFFGLNFRGNIACTNETDVTFFSFEKAPDLGNIRHADSRAGLDLRGCQAHRWEFEKVVRAGFATATICYQDIFLDRPDGFDTSIMRFFYDREQWYGNARTSGAISAWAWGVQRALDYLEQQDELDAKHIIVHGHSRLGKTALWAGANDPRIWLTVSNCSGTGGAKIAHRYFGESFAWLNLWFPYWFCSNFAGYAGRESEFPIDQHVVMAAIAPRLLFIASASEDLHADPRGEYSGGVLASEAWNIFGRQGLENTNFPPCSKLIGGDVGYYLRPGNHDFMPENWDALLEFVKRHLAQEKIQKC